MFCHKCGTKVATESAFCPKCGEKLITDEAASKTSAVTAPKSVELPPVIEAVGTVEVGALLKESMSRCPVIKGVTQNTKWTVLKGTIYQYMVLVVAGQAKIVPTLAFPYLILDVIAYGVICVTAANIGWDFAENGSIYFTDYALLLALGLLVGGLIKTITPFVGRKEKETVATYIRDILEPQGVALVPGTLKTRVSVARLAMSLVPALAGAIILIFVMVGNSGFGGSWSAPVAVSNTTAESVSLSQAYVNENEGFSFRYPNDWDVRENSTMAAVLAPAESGYRASIGIMKSDADEAYFSASMSDFETLYSPGKENLKMTNLSDIALNGYPARKLIFSFSDNRGSYTQIQYFYVLNRDMYFVTCSSLKDNFDKYEPVFNAIIGSYQITATIPPSSTLTEREAIQLVKKWFDEHGWPLSGTPSSTEEATIDGKEYYHFTLFSADEKGRYIIDIFVDIDTGEFTASEAWGVAEFVNPEPLERWYERIRALNEDGALFPIVLQ